MFDFSDIKNQTIKLSDIVNPLSKLQRFNAHTDLEFSVLQHSYFVGLMIYTETRNATATLAGMIHDFHEAFITDIPTPLKNLMRDKYNFTMKPITNELDEMIMRNLNIEFVREALYSETTHKYDALSLTYELANHFKPGFIRDDYNPTYENLLATVQSMSPKEVIEEFNKMFVWIVEDAIDEGTSAALELAKAA